MKKFIKYNGKLVRVDGKLLNIDTDAKTPETKTVTPTQSEQIITPTNNNYELERVTVNPIPSDYLIPTGTKQITENGTHNISEYENVTVDVEGGVNPSGTLEITENGIHNVTNYENVDVNVETGITPSGTKQITTNGTYDVTEYSSAEVIVPSSTPTLTNKNITENGTYEASNDNVDGYSIVTVDVPDNLNCEFDESTGTLTINEGGSGGGGSSDEIISAMLQTNGLKGEFIIPDGVKEIKTYALYNQSNVTKIKIPNSVTTMGNHSCGYMTGVNEFIYDGNLSQTAISNIYPLYRTGADNSKFIVGKNASVIPNSFLGTTGEAYMPKFAYFYNEPRTKNLDIGNLQTSSTNAANSNMKKIWLDDFGGANLSLGQNTFRNFNSLTTIYFNAKNITNSHSSGSPFNQGGNNAIVKFGEDVQSIGDRILNAALVKNVYIGSNVKIIGAKGLNITSTNLKAITVDCENPPTIQSDTLYSSTVPIYIPKGTLSKYSGATNWSAQASRFVELETSIYTDGTSTLKLSNNSWFDVNLDGEFYNGTYTLTDSALSLVVFRKEGNITISGTITDNVVTIVKGANTYTLTLEA